MAVEQAILMMTSVATLSQESLEAILFHPLVRKRDITLNRALQEQDEDCES